MNVLEQMRGVGGRLSWNEDRFFVGWGGGADVNVLGREVRVGGRLSVAVAHCSMEGLDERGM